MKLIYVFLLMMLMVPVQAMNLKKLFGCMCVEDSRDFMSYWRQGEFEVFLKKKKKPEVACKEILRSWEKKADIHQKTFLVYVLDNYGVDEGPSLEDWRNLLMLLVRHEYTDMSDGVYTVDQSDGCSIYSPLSLLLFKNYTSPLGYYQAAPTCGYALDALTLFKNEKVHFEPMQTTTERFYGYDSKIRFCTERSIFWYIFNVYNGDYRGYIFDKDILDSVIEHLIELGVDTEFYYSEEELSDDGKSSTKETFYIDEALCAMKNEHLKETFKKACLKRDMPREGLQRYDVLRRLCNVKFRFE